MVLFPPFQAFASGLLHGVTSAEEGNFNDEDPGFLTTLQHFTAKNKLPRLPHYLQQIHGKRVIKIPSDTPLVPEGDALITNQPAVPLMVKTADCQGILVYAPDVHALGIIHSGWRGSTQNIIGHTLAEMTKEYGADPKQMTVAIGPSLGPCCAEFTDPKTELPSFCHPFIQGRKVNLWQLSLSQCQNAGVPLDQVELVRHCTKCQPGYFSHRRGDSGRFITWGMLR